MAAKFDQAQTLSFNCFRLDVDFHDCCNLFGVGFYVKRIVFSSPKTSFYVKKWVFCNDDKSLKLKSKNKKKWVKESNVTSTLWKSEHKIGGGVCVGCVVGEWRGVGGTKTLNTILWRSEIFFCSICVPTKGVLLRNMESWWATSFSAGRSHRRRSNTQKKKQDKNWRDELTNWSNKLLLAIIATAVRCEHKHHQHQ